MSKMLTFLEIRRVEDREHALRVSQDPSLLIRLFRGIIDHNCYMVLRIEKSGEQIFNFTKQCATF